VNTARRLASLCLLAASAIPAQEAPPRKGFAVTITEPENQSVVAGRARIGATVRVDDPELVDRVEFFVDDRRIFVDRERPYECVHDFGPPTRSSVVRAVAYHREQVSVADTVITRKLGFWTVERVNRVVLWASARDREGRFVDDLRAGDLRLFEDGVEQTILELSREERPLTLALLLDSSGSMREKLDDVHAAAGAFVATLRPGNRALVIDFDDKAFLLEDLTGDVERLRAAVAGTEALGGTALYDALHAAYRKIGGLEGRRAIVLLSDGDDSASQIPYRRILEEARSSPVIIHTIGLGGDGPSVRRDVLRELAEVTGGRAYFVKNSKDLGGAYEQIAAELRAQHVLSYQTSNQTWDARWIELRIESNRAGVQVHARKGFLATRQDGPAEGTP